ncbi:MAG: outer membrane beta-barrel domain-containing protein [Oligoflexia bacterium]|nr:outer membrane beta-barrel domain-containing protein [Oligoflexia bacterium]
MIMTTKSSTIVMMIIVMVIMIMMPLLTLEYLYAGEKSAYEFDWLEKKDIIFVLQNKEFPITKKFNTELKFIDSSGASVFQKTYGFEVMLSYYFSEVFGINAFYDRMNNSDSGALQNLAEVNNAKPFIRRFNSMFGLGVDWIPLYGKINAFNEIFYMNLGLGFAYNSIQAESNLKTFSRTNSTIHYEAESFTGYSSRFFFKFFFSRRWNIIYEYRYLYYSGQDSPAGPAKGFLVKDTSVGIGVLF